MFDWSEEEVEEFFCNNMECLAKILDPRDGAKYYMDKLLNDGHELYLISHRVYPHYNNPEKITKDWLNNNNINYTKLILSKTTDKSPECFENKIDIMFDDVVSNCKRLKAAGINTYLMETKYNKSPKEDLKTVDNWEELYNVICKFI
ncbi:5' nucleotidase, deoxy (Pyrimidine), cytosolic type C protein (NT5C) [compost metagenome]